MTRFIVLLAFVLFVAGCGDVRDATGRSATGPVSLNQARTISDNLAKSELQKQEKIHRRDDPKVKLGLEDYKVTASEDADSYNFFYEHERNADVGFVLWKGHPMHFSVSVAKQTGKTRLFCGE